MLTDGAQTQPLRRGCAIRKCTPTARSAVPATNTSVPSRSSPGTFADDDAE